MTHVILEDIKHVRQPESIVENKAEDSILKDIMDVQQPESIVENIVENLAPIELFEVGDNPLHQAIVESIKINDNNILHRKKLRGVIFLSRKQ